MYPNWRIFPFLNVINFTVNKNLLKMNIICNKYTKHKIRIKDSTEKKRNK